MAREVIDIIIQQRGGRRVASDVRDIGSAADATQGRVSLLRTALRGLVGAFGVREVLQSIDAYQRMQNQLRVVGYETEQLAQAQGRLFEIAQRTRTPLEETVNLYGKLAQSAGELGKSQDEMMRFTELTGKALAIQGTSTQGSRAALLQLSQAMGEGIVRAQEYNSLVENARPLLLAAATGMDAAGGSVARLRTLVIEGKVSSTEFFDAVLKGGKLLEEQFGNTIPTIGQSLTVLRNAWIQFIGESATGQAILSAVTGTLIYLAQNFETVAVYAVAAGGAFAAYWGAGVISGAATAIVGAVRAQTALNLALGATGPASAIAATGLKAVQFAIRGVTAAMAANPIGALLILTIGLATWLFTIRDRMISFGGTTASVGSLVVAVWQQVVGAVKVVWVAITSLAGVAVTAFTNMTGYAGTFVTNVVGYLGTLLSSWGLTFENVVGIVKDGINLTIGYHVGMVKSASVIITTGIPAAFRLAMGIALNIVLDALAGIVNAFASGLGSVGDALDNIPGIDGAGAAIRDSLTVDFSGLRADVGALGADVVGVGAEIAGAMQGALNVDYIGGATAALGSFRDGITELTTEVFTAAAARDEAMANVPDVQEFEFAPSNAPALDSLGGGGGGGGDGGAGKAKGLSDAKKELTETEEALKKITEETTGAFSKLRAEEEALQLALQQGILTQEQYGVRMAGLSVEFAKLQLEGTNVAAAVKEANEEIVQLKIDAGQGGFADGFLLELSRMTEGVKSFASQSGTIFGNFFTTFTDGFANSVGRAIVYSEDLGQSLRGVAQEALAQLISGFVKMGIQMLINKTISAGIAAASTATTVAAAGASAAAWAPAAALASLATVGANAAPAAAGIASTTALATAVGAAGGGLKDGGLVSGPGGPRDDKVLRALSDGEFVVNARATRKNFALLTKINSGGGAALGGVRTTASGGRTLGGTDGAGSSGNTVIQVNVENFTGQEVRVEQEGDNKIRIIAGQEAERVVLERVPRMIGDEISNPNSRASGALAQNTNVERRR